jgi:hypothetical protein
MADSKIQQIFQTVKIFLSKPSKSDQKSHQTRIINYFWLVDFKSLTEDIRLRKSRIKQQQYLAVCDLIGGLVIPSSRTQEPLGIIKKNSGFLKQMERGRACRDAS